MGVRAAGPAVRTALRRLFGGCSSGGPRNLAYLMAASSAVLEVEPGRCFCFLTPGSGLYLMAKGFRVPGCGSLTFW